MTRARTFVPVVLLLLAAVSFVGARPVAAAGHCTGTGGDAFGGECDDPGDGAYDGRPGPAVYYAWRGTWMALPGELPGNPGEENGCWGAEIVGGPYATPPPGQSYAEAIASIADVADNGALWGPCPIEDAFDIDAYVARYWSEVVRPPPPSPLRVGNGRLLVTFNGYLEIGGDPTPEWRLENPIGPTIVIRAAVRYVVHWGDGAETGTTSRGRPYPGGDGEVTHRYGVSGSKTITVDAYWHASWTAGGDGGQLPELPTPTTSDLTLPVLSAQAATD